MDPTGPIFMLYIFGLAIVGSGAVVIVLKSPLKSLVAAFVQLIVLFLFLGAQGDWVIGGGVLLILGTLYARSLQFLRAMEPSLIQTRHRLRYSQVLGLILSLLIGLFVALHLIAETPPQIIFAWLLFVVGMTGVLVRRNAFHFLMSLQMMFNAGIFVGFPLKIAGINSDLGWVLLLAIGATAYWVVGWSFMSSRLLTNRSLDIDNAHLLKS